MQQAQLWPRHVRRAANDVAKLTWSLQRTATIDVVANQVQYTMPSRMFYVSTVCVNDGFGNIWPLGSSNEALADNQLWNWRASGNVTGPTYQGVPSACIVEGLQTFKLIPVPNYSVEDGLIVGGYFGVDKWWSMSDECPLPDDEEYNEAVEVGACYRRCMEMKSVDPLYAAGAVDYKLQADEIIRNLYRQSTTANQSRRDGTIPSLGNRMGNWGAAGWNWVG